MKNNSSTLHYTLNVYYLDSETEQLLFDLLTLDFVIRHGRGRICLYVFPSKERYEEYSRYPIPTAQVVIHKTYVYKRIQ